MLRKWIIALLTATCLTIGSPALAYTDDAGVMDHFNYDNSMYMWDYLNQNGYHLHHQRTDKWVEKTDTYLKDDNSIAIEISNDPRYNDPRIHRKDDIKSGQMINLFILRAGVKTDKGIQVGDSFRDVVNAYGIPSQAISTRTDFLKNTPNTGTYDWKSFRSFTHYLVRYRDFKNDSSIQFLINDKTNKVVAIRYWRYNAGKTYFPEYLSNQDLWELLPTYQK